MRDVIVTQNITVDGVVEAGRLVRPGRRWIGHHSLRIGCRLALMYRRTE
jgi:hypothetical protein